MTIGTKIRNLRKENHLTQEKLAKTLGISRFSLINYEKGARKLPPKVKAKIEEEFGVELEEDFSEFPKSSIEIPLIDKSFYLNNAPENMSIECFKSFLSLTGYSASEITYEELLKLHKKVCDYIDFEFFKKGHIRIR